MFNKVSKTQPSFLSNRIVEKLILYGFSLYGNGRLKRFVNCCYGIFNNSNIKMKTIYIFFRL
ncbi:hypothetical protein AMR47_01635 [Leptospira interrogans]|nr:hypothetical protein AMR47_01635 [Leptospira interrogans]